MTTRTKPHAGPSDGPLPPVPPVNPPQKITGLLNAIKVFLIAELALALKYAWTANGHFTDWDQFKDLSQWPTLLHVTTNAFVYGLIPGALLGFMTLLAAWAGPELWAYVGPIILVAAKRSIAFLRGMSRAFRGLPEPRTRNRRKPKGTEGAEKNG